jgi:hypothetical protein
VRIHGREGEVMPPIMPAAATSTAHGGVPLMIFPLLLALVRSESRKRARIGDTWSSISRHLASHGLRSFLSDAQRRR